MTGPVRRFAEGSCIRRGLPLIALARSITVPTRAAGPHNDVPELSGGSVAYCRMALLRRFRAWWNKDTLVRAEEETRMTESERDTAEEDYEARKDDVAARSENL